MNVSLNWIKKYVKIPAEIDPKELGSRLTLSTVEVEGFENQATALDKVVVGKIVELLPHPNADRLRLVSVDCGTETVRVVCGGTNLAVGMLVALAGLGARVRWHGEGDLVTLEPAKIRGEESTGMICAASELGLENLFPASSDGEIIDLTPLKLKVGAPLATALKLDDVIYDIDNKSITNRPDLWGHYGMAREVAAIFNLKLDAYKAADIKESKDLPLSVTVEEPELCPRYQAVTIDNVTVGPSPEWLVKSLQSVGLHSVNNIVDVTNYILFDLGQPLHAFDASYIKNNKIIVRRAKKGETLKTLDGVERSLTTENLLICDSEKVLALAGVMGGESSEITDNTKRIVVESANFEPFCIRKTSEQFALRTEASIRYEKSLDPLLTEVALRRAVELILEVCPDAKVASAVVDEFPTKPSAKTIETTFSFLCARIGADLDNKYIKEVLTRLGFDLKVKGDNLEIIVPSWRATKDVSIPEDIVEEVARMYGYDNLTPLAPLLVIEPPEENKLRTLERQVKNILVNSFGATEVYNYSFVGQAQIENLGLNTKSHVELLNPASEEATLMRRSLLPGLVNNLIDNLRFQEQLNFFEVGKVFIREEAGENLRPGTDLTLPAQPLMMSGLFLLNNVADPVYQVKAIVEAVLGNFNVKTNETINSGVPEWLHPERYLAYRLASGELLAEVGELHPRITTALDVSGHVGYWQINLSKLLEVANRETSYHPVSKFPAVTMDIAIVVPRKTLWKTVADLVFSTVPEYIREVSLFDEYKNDKIGIENKSLAFRVVYQADDRTLEAAEVAEWQKKIIDNLVKAVGARVRE